MAQRVLIGNVKGDKGDDGDPGESAYQIAVNGGFSGTEQQWLDSLVGGGATVSDATPVMDGTATPGTSIQASRADHVHPSDTAKLSLSGGTVTGEVILDTNAKFAAGGEFVGNRVQPNLRVRNTITTLNPPLSVGGKAYEQPLATRRDVDLGIIPSVRLMKTGRFWYPGGQGLAVNVTGFAQPGDKLCLFRKNRRGGSTPATLIKPSGGPAQTDYNRVGFSHPDSKSRRSDRGFWGQARVEWDIGYLSENKAYLLFYLHQYFAPVIGFTLAGNTRTYFFKSRMGGQNHRGNHYQLAFAVRRGPRYGPMSQIADIRILSDTISTTWPVQYQRPNFQVAFR